MYPSARAVITKHHRLGAGSCLFLVLDAGSPSRDASRMGPGEKALPGLQTAASSLYPHTASPMASPSPGVCASSCKDSGPMTFMTTFNLNHLLKSPVSKYRHTEG